MKTRTKLVLIPFLLAQLVITGFLLSQGCAGTPAQRVAYQTTDAIGQAVNDAENAFVAFEIQKAQSTLGGVPTKTQITAWVSADQNFVRYCALKDKFNQAYNVWCVANAAVAGNTNAASAFADPQFRADAINAAFQLTTFIASFVPSVKVVQPNS